MQDLELRGEQGKKYRKSGADYKEVIANLIKHPKDYSILSERIYLQSLISKNKVPQYLPPVQKESNINLEIQGVILQKKSKFEFDINRM